jgi:hypothetical protein
MNGLNDMRHLQADLSPEERRAANEKLARLRMLEILGDRYVLHPKHAPRKAVYNPVTGKFLGEAA